MPRQAQFKFSIAVSEDDRQIAQMKQVIVVNTALTLPPGKMAAQVAHAAVAAFLTAPPASQQGWLQAGMPKVVLRGDDEKSLHDLLSLSEAAGIPAYMIRDAGRTVVAEVTVTCLGIGPAEIAEIDKLTGELKLL